jgi:hypothetical protein
MIPPGSDRPKRRSRPNSAALSVPCRDPTTVMTFLVVGHEVGDPKARPVVIPAVRGMFRPEGKMAFNGHPSFPVGYLPEANRKVGHGAQPDGPDKRPHLTSASTPAYGTSAGCPHQRRFHSETADVAVWLHANPSRFRRTLSTRKRPSHLPAGEGRTRKAGPTAYADCRKIRPTLRINGSGSPAKAASKGVRIVADGSNE